MIDKLESRLAYVAKSSIERNIDNKRKLCINITNTLPIVHIDTTLADNRQLLTKNNAAIGGTILNNLASDDDVIDEVSGDVTSYRYIFISRSESNLYKNIIDVYYDTKYNDILIIPTTQYLGNESMENPHTNTIKTITGYRLGGHGNLDSSRIGNKYLPVTSKFNMPVISTRLDNKFMYINIPGLHTPHGSEFLKVAVNENPLTDMISNSNRGVGITTLTLPAPISVPLYGVIQYGVDSYRLEYLGIKKTSTISFLLDY